MPPPAIKIRAYTGEPRPWNERLLADDWILGISGTGDTAVMLLAPYTGGGFPLEIRLSGVTVLTIKPHAFEEEGDPPYVSYARKNSTEGLTKLTVQGPEDDLLFEVVYESATARTIEHITYNERAFTV